VYVVFCKPEVTPFDFQLTQFFSLSGNCSLYSIGFPRRQHTALLDRLSRLSPVGFLKDVQNIGLKKDTDFL